MPQHPDHTFMQDNAPSHTSAQTTIEIASRRIRTALWPPYSPDLNPIEQVSAKMKDWIQIQYPQEKMPQSRMRMVVMEAWDAITDEYLRDLVASMPARCDAVVAANGLFSKY